MIGASSDAEVIRCAIERFDPDAINSEDRRQVEQTVAALRDQIDELKARIDDTLARVAKARDKMNNPSWVAEVRERARAEAQRDPALTAGIASLFGA
jgi:uncharacterized membrane protein